MPECKYGDKCYRKNEDHLRECHPERMSKENDEKNKSPETTVDKVPKKRKVAIHMEEEGEERKVAKIMKEDEGDEEEVEVAEEMVEEFEEFYEESEIVEEPEETEGNEGEADTLPSNSKSAPSSSIDHHPHRSPFCPQPPSIYSLWKKAVQFEPENPRDAFSEINGMRLVGFFDFLAGDLKDATDDEIRLHARYATDLPEMQTIMITHTGRYALWRDDPKHLTAMVVYVKKGDEHFTKITQVGDKPVHALVHAAGEGADAMLAKFYPISVHKYATVSRLKHDAKTAISRRSKNSLGRPLHSMRLWVHIDESDVGYRSLGEDLNKLKRTMIQVGESTDEVVRKKKMAELREVGTNVQLAIDECDFGTSLEWGHDLFCANYAQLDPMAKRFLSIAYQYLGRHEFEAIVEAQMEAGVRRREKVMINE